MQRQRTIETYDQGFLIDSRTETFTTSAEFDNEETIRERALAALAANRTFIQSAKPSTAAAQASAAYDQAKAQARQLNGVIRLLLGVLDGVE